ncbi:MAG TPA: MEDS domain-containing protein [Actinomycetota bacterium]|nr:MEDS domain-containing protein [Actinomycetota bacterium]
MTAETTPIVQTHDHVCLIHWGETSRRPVVLQWAREGLSAGEGTVLIEPPSTGDELAELIGGDSDPLIVVDPGTLYASGDDGAVIAERLHRAATSVDGDKAPAARMSVPAAYGLAVHGDQTHLEHERAYARIVEERPVAMLCQYDQVEVDGALIARAAAEHEIVVQLDDLALPTLDMRPTDKGVRLSGEIDMANHEVVRSWMSRHRGRPLTVDCSNLTFLDVAGLRALTSWATEDTPLILEHVDGEPAKLLSTSLFGSLPVHVAGARAGH